MMGKISISLRKSAWLLALLIITTALPARAQEEDTDVYMQEGQFNFEYGDDLNGYIISPDKDSGWEWDRSEVVMLEVPSTRLKDGKPVVGLSGFGSLKYLDVIHFESPCHVKYICDNCFQYCTSLGASQELTLPETVETIGQGAFYECTGLQVVKFGSNLKSIGVSAFEKCSSLTSITLPKSLKILSENAFRNCANFDNWGNFIGGGLESVVFEDGVDFYTNDVYCFYNNVFWGCANLSSVKLPNGTPGRFVIPMGTFGYCSNLRSIEFPPNTGKIEHMAFYRSGLDTLDLTNITWKDTFYLDGYYTFAACENLTTVKAKGKVRFDGLYTFQDCTALKTVTFTGEGDDYTVMNPDIFKRCSNLESVEFYHLKGNRQDNDMDSVFTDCKKLVSVTSTLPPEISKIGYSCFDGCESLMTLSLPKQLFAINETAFRGCTALTSFDFANVSSIGKGSFSGCTGLISVPNISHLTSITESAFEGCTSLPSLEFADLASIGTKAFAGCTALTSIKFTNNPPTETIENAFDEWHFTNTLIDVLDEKYSTFVADAVGGEFLKIKHPTLFAYTPVEGGYSIAKGQFALSEDFAGMLEIPTEYETGKVVAIAAGAFEGLTGLTGVTLPKDLTAVGANAFAKCTGITTVINKRSEPLTADACPASAFASETYSGTLTVPFGSLEAYSNCEPWSAFSKIEQGLGDRTLAKPTASHKEGDFNDAFDLTLTNPNESGTIYYYLIPDGDTSTGVREVLAYESPITVPATNCTVVAYVTDGTVCSEPISFVFKYIPCKIDETTNVPQGTKEVSFTTDTEQSLNNVVIDDIYYSIKDDAGGIDATNGLVLNATSSPADVAQFNSDVENGLDPATKFNGIAVKVQGVGSITFTGVENKGNARLTLVLGDGSPVYVDDLTGGKYEFSLPVTKYLYIFASQTAPSAAPQLKAPAPGENGVTLKAITLEVSELYISTEVGLDKILAANPGESYRIRINLDGHYFDGTYLYASTVGGASGSSKNTHNLDKVGNKGSDDPYQFKNQDWVAISGLTEQYLGGINFLEYPVVEVVSNDAYPVISFPVKPDLGLVVPGTPEHNTFRVENFNFKADNPAVNNIWLAAPQPAEYCTLRGFVRMENIHAEDGYLELMSEEYTKIAADETPIPPLSVKVYYSNAAVSDALDVTAWYDFTGIVSREGEDLVFTALTAEYKLPSAIEDVEATSGARISAANGSINVVCDAPTTITVYSVTGQLVATVEATTATIPVAPGLYLVKAGSQTTKLSVR